MSAQPFFIGTAGWSVASRHNSHFPETGSHLERYAARLHAVEINSSFYRPHRRETYERWAASVPDRFRFSVKLPKTITHEHRLAECDLLLDAFLEQAGGLGMKLGVLLVQTPPSLRFDRSVAEPFFGSLRRKTDAAIACEPRHASWFGAEAETLLEQLHVARVAADPSPHEGAALPAGWPQLAYFRMHGSPRIYYSDYPADALRKLARQLAEARRTAAQVWCIFDNTAAGHALDNAVVTDTALNADAAQLRRSTG